MYRLAANVITQKRVEHVWRLCFLVGGGRMGPALYGAFDICPGDDRVTAMATVAVIDKEAVLDSLCVIFPRFFPLFPTFPAFPQIVPIFTHIGNADEF